MRKLTLKILFLTLIVVTPVSVMAGVSVHVDIPLPPPIVFPAPPEVVVLPETDVYAVPDVDVDIFSTAAGGGVHGKAAGTAPVTTTGAGFTTGMFLHFTGTFPPVGEMITEIESGEDMNGIISEYHIMTLNKIGAAGKETNIGKESTRGVSRDYLQKGKEKSILRDIRAVPARAPTSSSPVN